MGLKVTPVVGWRYLQDLWNQKSDDSDTTDALWDPVMASDLSVTDRTTMNKVRKLRMGTHRTVEYLYACILGS